MPFRNVVEPFRAEPAYRCPCCRGLLLHARGDDEICPNCGWQDDGQDDHDADVVRGGPNGSESLTDARARYAHRRAGGGERWRPPALSGRSAPPRPCTSG